MRYSTLILSGLAFASTSLAVPAPASLDSTAINTTAAVDLATGNPFIHLATLKEEDKTAGTPYDPKQDAGETNVILLCPEEQAAARTCLGLYAENDPDSPIGLKYATDFDKTLKKCMKQHKWECVKWKGKNDFCADKSVKNVEVTHHGKGKVKEVNLEVKYDGHGDKTWEQKRRDMMVDGEWDVVERQVVPLSSWVLPVEVANAEDMGEWEDDQDGVGEEPEAEAEADAVKRQLVPDLSINIDEAMDRLKHLAEEQRGR